MLFSPIAHEDISNPNLPDGKESNLRLAVYTEATRETAKSVGVTYVDLFASSHALYAANNAPLTINGIHLNEIGNRLMAMPKDFQIEVFADEQQFPDLVNPVQMQVDAKGRLWAAVWPTYPKQQAIRDINDALLISKDTDCDGRADEVVKFAEIPNPLGFEFWNDGVIVSAQPNLLFLRDRDGDDIADERYVLLHGLGSADSHHAANNLIYGSCGGIYWQSGIFPHNKL